MGSIPQMVKRRLTDTHAHTVSQWQSWGQTTLADPWLLQVTACHKLQTLMPYSEDPGELPVASLEGVSSVPWCHLELLWCRAPGLQLVWPGTSCQLSRLPALCFLIRSCWLSTQAGQTQPGWGPVPLLPYGSSASSIKTNQLIPLALVPSWHSKHPVRGPSPTVAAQADLGS